SQLTKSSYGFIPSRCFFHHNSRCSHHGGGTNTLSIPPSITCQPSDRPNFLDILQAHHFTITGIPPPTCSEHSSALVSIFYLFFSSFPHGDTPFHIVNTSLIIILCMSVQNQISPFYHG